MNAQARPLTPPPAARPGGLTTPSEIRGIRSRLQDAGLRADRYLVEVHKKWAIAFACLPFALIGIVVALRFPRGGVGLVIGGGMGVFAIFWVGLTAGETLADRGYVWPWLSMWAPNIILGILGLIGLLAVSREMGSTRGGDWQEIAQWLRDHWISLRRRVLP